MQFAIDTTGAPNRRRPVVRPRNWLVLGMLSASAAALACGVAFAQAPSSIQIAPVPGAAAGAGQGVVIREGVATVVNNDIISTYDLRQRILLLVVSSGVRPTAETLPALEREALRDLIDETLQMQEIRRIETTRGVSIQPTDEEIDEEISLLAQQNGITAQQLISSLAGAGVSVQSLRDQIRAETSWRRYVSGAFSGSVTVGEDQVNAMYQQVQAAATQPQYLMAEIFIESQRAGGPEAAVEGARQLAAQIEQGAPFAAVARQFSSAATAAAGGDAGWVLSGDVPEPVERAMEQMRPGQLSPPIPVPGGAYIVLLREKRSGSETTVVDLKQAAIRLPAAASQSETMAAVQRLESLRGQIDSCDTFESRADGVEGVVAGSLGETELDDLSPSFRDAIAGLQPGQVSQPVRSDAGLHLVALCGRRAAGGDMPTRENIRDRLFEQELSMIARRQLRNLRNSANIENR